MTYRFGDFEVDVLAYELRQRGQPVRLARQPMDLLLLLLDRRQELVSREDIANRLWGPDIHIDIEAGIHTAILKIRQVLGVSRELPPFVETVPGKGYRFVAPVDVVTQPDREKSPALFGTPPRPFDALPAELTSFVGRRQACLELPEILASARLLSLTGGGGVGKTRLAVRLARDLIDRFADGVWFVDLGSLSMPDLIAQTIATTIGIREGPQRSARESLLEALRDRELLLVLDTCEHLLDDCADIVEDLLRRAPTLRIVTTSREALGVSGEIIYRVPSLTMPDASISVSVDALAEFEATRLFMERARGVDPTFVAAADNAAAIAGLCRRLDGIPLAIELAAARVAVLSPEQIEARLEDRFRLLTGGARTVVARQRTLEATVDWSYQLLSDVERHLLCRLAVFPASWTIEAAEQVCSGNRFKERDVLDLLSRLVGKSLVVTESDSGAMRRYRLPETVRQYARRRLVDEGDADRLGEQHFEHFFTEFRGALPILRHHDQVRCLRRLRIEQDNVRAALDWALTSVSHAEKGVELAGALFWFWTKRGLYQEGRLWLERALTVRSDVHQGLRARALIGLAHMDHFQGRSFVGTAAEALRLGREADDAWVISFALFLQALGALATGDHEAAAQLSLDAQAAASLCGDEVQLAGPLLILANIAVANGDYGRAQHLYDDAIAVERRAGEIWGLTIVLSAAAGLGILREDFEGARAQASEVLCLSQQLEDPRGIAWSLEVSAGLMVAGGHSDNAAQLWGASDRLLEAVGGLLSPEIRWIRDRYIDCAKASLGTQAFESLRNDGRAMPIDRAIALTQQHARLVG